MECRVKFEIVDDGYVIETWSCNQGVKKKVFKDYTEAATYIGQFVGALKDKETLEVKDKQ